MRFLALSAVRFLLLATVLLLPSLDARAQPAAGCDDRRDRCRAACFDRHARQGPPGEAALARCREQCNQQWLACTHGR